MPGMDGIEATRLITKANPGIKVIILTSLGDSETLIEAVKAGASGYLLKNLDGDELIDCLRSLAAGKNPFSGGARGVPAPRIPARLAPQRRGRARGRAWGRGPRRSLRFLCEGLTYKQIGAELFISERTIKYHIERTKKSLGLETKAQLVDYWRGRA